MKKAAFYSQSIFLVLCVFFSQHVLAAGKGPEINQFVRSGDVAGSVLEANDGTAGYYEVQVDINGDGTDNSDNYNINILASGGCQLYSPNNSPSTNTATSVIWADKSDNGDKDYRVNIKTTTALTACTLQVNTNMDNSAPSGFSSGDASYTYKINQTASITGAPASSKTFIVGETGFTLTAVANTTTAQGGTKYNTAGVSGNINWSSAGNACSVSSGGAVAFDQAGTCSVRLTAGNANLATATAQTTSWTVYALQRVAPYTITRYSNGATIPGGAISTTETPDICTVNENRTLFARMAGTCKIRVYEGSNYQTIDWPILADGDFDGVPDTKDNCPSIANANQLDQNTDGEGNACDSDMDGDGFDNDLDICPDVNNPGQNKLMDNCWTTGDSDSDGYTNNVDTCPNKANPGNLDSDSDGKGDACDDDIDGDGKLNVGDNCPETANPDQGDANGDGVGDACERKFVKTTGSDLNDCSSWAAACQTIQRGITAAESDGLKQVFVAQGVYRLSTPITLKKGFSIYGGFSGAANELTPAFARPTENKTIISGDSDYLTQADDVDEHGIVQSVSGIVGTNLSNSLMVAINQNTAGVITAADKIRLSGLILNAGSNTQAGRGGALTVTASNVELVNTKVIANRSLLGGALYLSGNGSLVTIDGSTLQNNQSTSGGAGAIYDIILAGGAVTVTNSTLAGNSTPASQSGGAIHKAPTSTSKMVIRNTTLENNTAGYAGAIYHQGGRIEIGNGTVFRGNKAITGAGGAIRHGASAATSAVLLVDKTEFSDNHAATQGGALYLGSTTSANDELVIANSLFWGNKAANNGGAINTQTTTATMAKLRVVNNTFYQNLAGANADGLASAATGYGGALYVNATNKSAIELDYNTFVANESKSASGQGGAIYVQSGMTPASLFKISRSLLAGNITIDPANGLNAWLGAAVTDNGYNLLGFNNVQGISGAGALSHASNVKPGIDVPTLDKIVESEPKVDGGDGYISTIPVLAIKKEAKAAHDAIPALACGDVVTDARGEKRPDSKVNRCDIGAYEYTTLSCQEDAQRRYDQGELFIKACTPETEKFELKVGAWNGLALVLLGLLAVLRRRHPM